MLETRGAKHLGAAGARNQGVARVVEARQAGVLLMGAVSGVKNRVATKWLFAIRVLKDRRVCAKHMGNASGAKNPVAIKSL